MRKIVLLRERMASAPAVLAAVALVVAGALSCGGRVELDQDMRNILSYTFGGSREPLSVIEDRVKESYGDAEVRLNLERQFAEVLRTETATYDCKDFVCRQLRVMGTKESVPALYTLLLDPETADMARYALQENTCEEAGEALRKALGKTGGTALVGIVNSLGERRDEKAAGPLEKLVQGSDAEVAAAARDALVKIRGR